MRFPRTIIFVDLSGFTEYIETRGDEAAVELLHRFRRIGRDLAADSDAPVRERLALGFGNSTFRYAGPIGRGWTAADLAGMQKYETDDLRNILERASLMTDGPAIERRHLPPEICAAACAGATSAPLPMHSLSLARIWSPTAR